MSVPVLRSSLSKQFFVISIIISDENGSTTLFLNHNCWFPKEACIFDSYQEADQYIKGNMSLIESISGLKDVKILSLES